LNTGIMFLFVIPYILVAVIGYLWYRNSKRAQAERQLVAARVRSAYDS
jgi:cytochrome c-type biogenesis protein CcmH/NrfF